MSETGRKQKKGISIRLIHLAMILCVAVIAGLLVLSTYQSSNVFSTLSRETENYIVRQKAAHDLMEASDYLTEMAQRFTLEGDAKYLDNYFEEALVSRRRENAIAAMSENEAEQTLVQQLQEAMDESTALMYREYYAMKLTAEALEIREYPETLKAIELKEEDVFLSAEMKMDKAREMVTGKEYYASKEIIRSRLKNDLELLDRQMASTRQDTSARMMQELYAARIVVICLTAVLVFLIWLTARLSTIPLIRASESIRNKQAIPLDGSREFRQLAENYNEMYGSLHHENPETNDPE